MRTWMLETGVQRVVLATAFVVENCWLNPPPTFEVGAARGLLCLATMAGHNVASVSAHQHQKLVETYGDLPEVECWPKMRSYQRGQLLAVGVANALLFSVTGLVGLAFGLLFPVYRSRRAALHSWAAVSLRAVAQYASRLGM